MRAHQRTATQESVGELKSNIMEQVVIKSFATEMEAELAKNMLKAYGIKSFIQNKGTHSSGVPDDRYGTDLIVLEKDSEKTRELLSATSQ